MKKPGVHKTEYEKAVVLANRLLDEPYSDPDDDLRMLSRQFLRQIERTDRAVIAERERTEEMMSRSYRLGVVRSARVARDAGFNDVAEDIENDTSIGEGVGDV